MKLAIALITVALGAACTSTDDMIAYHIKAEYDFHSHQQYIDDLYTRNEPEYVDDCIFHSLDCDFE